MHERPYPFLCNSWQTFYLFREFLSLSITDNLAKGRVTSKRKHKENTITQGTMAKKLSHNLKYMIYVSDPVFAFTTTAMVIR